LDHNKETANDILNNKEKYHKEINKNLDFINKRKEKTIKQTITSTRKQLELLQQDTSVDKIYDDYLVQNTAEQFNDRFKVLPLIGDIIRAFKLVPFRKSLSKEELEKSAIEFILGYPSRHDISLLTNINTIEGNFFIPFLNGGPFGENWNTAKDGFYDWIDNKCSESIIGIELGFKADEYGIEVANKLIEKKRKNPHIIIGIILDGLVSMLMSSKKANLNEFERNTIKMINNMRNEGINIFINDSWNPLSLDFLAATHIKLWIFDAKVAFIGGIGIESQFRKILFDEMDLISGPFVNVLTSIALLLMSNQKVDLYLRNNFDKLFELNEIGLKNNFFKPLEKKGEMTMKLAMNIPGYIQDSQKEYINLLNNEYIEEIYLMAPYFSDDKVARTLIKTANKMKDGIAKHIEHSIKDKSNRKDKEKIKKTVLLKLKEEKKIHILFPKKQESRIIEEISRYYAYYLRDNPIVETLQFSAKNEEEFFDMLHAKQLLVILHNNENKWKKYVKYCGSYNPAGRAHNMWELNTLIYHGKWDTSDDDYDNSENLVKKYYEEHIKFVFENYTEPFPWGSKQIKLNLLERARMKLAQLLWF
jgi:hypothetical protein